ncbi:hypothetical protein MSG28_008076 [Choristoneura fumiferana]|uniref:Uncharacterized protein n=1 Tax=Choristoneura fumiferana TaxID=7141 RepID=A0ACC0J9Z6_CHOFU|nr:hypothetical protein MSG28_008076 [Choristoneura fumiferana]
MAAKFLGEPTVITGSHDRTLKIWDLRSTETKFAGSSCNDLVTSDGAGSTIISGHYDKRIRFWDIRTEMSANHIVLQGKVTSLDLSRVGAADGAAYVWNTHSGKLEATLKDHTYERSGASRAAPARPGLIAVRAQHAALLYAREINKNMCDANLLYQLGNIKIYCMLPLGQFRYRWEGMGIAAEYRGMTFAPVPLPDLHTEDSIEAPAEPLDETESDNGEVFDFLRGMTTGIINRFT